MQNEEAKKLHDQAEANLWALYTALQEKNARLEELEAKFGELQSTVDNNDALQALVDELTEENNFLHKTLLNLDKQAA